MSAPIVGECLAGQRLRMRCVVRDYDGAPVTPTAIVVRAGMRDAVPNEVDVAIDDEGIATFDVEATTAGFLAYQVNVTEPVEAVEHGLVRVAAPVFGGL